MNGRQIGNKRDSNREPKLGKNDSNKWIKVGYVGTLLLQLSTQKYLLDNDDIVGTFPTEKKNTEIYNKLKVVSEFLGQHALAVAAESSRGATTQGANGSGVSETAPVTTVPFYLPTVETFAEAQLGRQAAGLRTNTRKETSSDALVAQHLSASCGISLNFLYHIDEYIYYSKQLI